MRAHSLARATLGIVGLATILPTAGSAIAATPPPYRGTWSTVVNNGDYMPTSSCNPSVPTSACKKFNSYNQPSVNANQVVVIRARSSGGEGGGGGQPVHGVYTRDMRVLGPVVRILDRSSVVPQPDNRGTLFTEPPSFPRIDLGSKTIVTRGNHQPVWQQTEGGVIVEQLGTTGIYANPFGPLVTATSKLGSLPAFSFFAVPGAPAGTPFDVFPGAPAVTNGSTIVFKGNYTQQGAGRTGVYYRKLVNAAIPVPDGAPLAPAAGINPVVLIANSVDTLIPGSSTVFGSTAPPSAANGQAVFAGFDDEAHPSLGGIYLAPLNSSRPNLSTLVAIGSQVPGASYGAKFNRFGEGLSFDGRYVAFWGAWGSATKTVRLYCPQEGNKDRRAFCNHTAQFDPVTGSYPGDPASICDDVTDPNYGISCYQEEQVPVNQGIFVYDLSTRQTRMIALAGTGNAGNNYNNNFGYGTTYSDFVYWNYSGMVPGTAGGSEGDDGEPAKWRSASFVAVSGFVNGWVPGPTFQIAFKARTGSIDPATNVYVRPVDGIYLGKGPAPAANIALVRTGMDGRSIDPEAVDGLGNGLPVTEMGLERDGFRGNALVVNVTMGSEAAGWAGVYLTRVPAQ
ncbi:MAG: hypothetical protein ACM3QY_04405 [Candidatus Levyibacteriota bacterium]